MLVYDFLSRHYLWLQKSTNGFISMLMITPLRALSKGLNKPITWFIANPKCSSQWYKRKNRRSAQTDYTFLLRRSSMISSLEVPGVMINAKAINIDRIILLFIEFISIIKNYRFLN